MSCRGTAQPLQRPTTPFTPAISDTSLSCSVIVAQTLVNDVHARETSEKAGRNTIGDLHPLRLASLFVTGHTKTSTTSRTRPYLSLYEEKTVKVHDAAQYNAFRLSCCDVREGLVMHEANMTSRTTPTMRGTTSCGILIIQTVVNLVCAKVQDTTATHLSTCPSDHEGGSPVALPLTWLRSEAIPKLATGYLQAQFAEWLPILGYAQLFLWP